MNHEATDPASLAAECQRRFQRHWKGDGMSDSPEPEYDEQFTGAVDLPPRPMTSDEADALLLAELPAGVDYSLSGNVHRYRIHGRLEIDMKACRASVYWAGVERKEYEAETWSELVDLVRADVGKAGRQI